MARLIGVVRQVVGEAFAVAADGSKRELMAGDRIYVDERLQTGATGAVAVDLAGGGELTLGRGSDMPLSPAILANHASHAYSHTTAPTEADLASVAQAQQAIAAGADPGQVTEPPSAGTAPNGGPASLGGGHSVVLLTEVGGTVEPVVGFPTAGVERVPEWPELRIDGFDNGSPAAALPPGPPVTPEPPIDPNPPVTPEPPVDPNPPVTPEPPVDPNPPVTPEPPVDPEPPEPPVTPEPPVNHGVTLSSGSLTLNEANLPSGSAPDSTALTQTGSFTVNAPDGLKTLTVGGIELIVDGHYVTSPQSITLPSGNTLTVGWNAETGEVDWSYTLNNPASQTEGAGGLAHDPIPVHAVDSDGDSADGTLDVRIVDDTPQANCDLAEVEQGGAVFGNVLGNDFFGADGREPTGGVVGVRAGGDTSTPASGGVDTVVQGLYGTLVIDENGEAAYHSDPSIEVPEGAQDVFVYTIRDGDGDLSSTTVTIDVKQPCAPPLEAEPTHGVTVHESALDLQQDGHDLAPGNSVGSDPLSTAETASGSLASVVHGGSGAIVFSLASGSDGVVQGQYGVLKLNGDGSYTYTLTDAPKTSPAANDGGNLTHDTFTYTATDAQGRTVTSQLVIDIVDDTPRAADLEYSATRDPVNSNVLLVVDNSESMKLPSGVDGLSRLDLAKQSILDLLDQYQALGDVRVQLVTFNSAADLPGGGWVDVATAKALVAALGAGNGTNYDAALAAAQQAFLQSGSLGDAQNLAYFFSDGNPTLSPEHSQPNNQPNPAEGDGIDSAEEAAWTTFLDAHQINAWAIGLGPDVSSEYLDPIAHNGATGSDANAFIVSDLGQLGAVLDGTVQGGVSGSLLSGGTFGADGGFVKTVTVDGTRYQYDGNQVTAHDGANHGSFNGISHTLTIDTALGGTLVINLDNGDFSYTPAAGGQAGNEQVGFTLSDNDGDLAHAGLVIHVEGGPSVPPPVAEPQAHDDLVITNILGSQINVSAAALLANDTVQGNSATVSTTTFQTGWQAGGADFTAAHLKTLGFSGRQDIDPNHLKNLSRADFNNSVGTLTAAVMISGFLGSLFASPSNSQDLYSVNLKAGEAVTLSHDLDDSRIGMAWQQDNGQFQLIGNGEQFVASEDNVYRFVLVNLNDSDPQDSAEHYTLTVSIDYKGAAFTPDTQGSYTLSDGHGGSDTAAVGLHYQAGPLLLGTQGDDVLIGGAGSEIHGGDGNDVLVASAGDNALYGDNGDDLLVSGEGNDLLDGGAGVNTASYALAKAGVTVSTELNSPQDTGGAGIDTLHNIQNLIGSNYDDHLSGDEQANRLEGGLGNDVLDGGAGNDVLVGGPGNDRLTGGLGDDTFTWLAGDTGHDVVTDFSFGADHLDLSKLLQGLGGGGDSLANLLHFKVDGSDASVVSSIEVSPTPGGVPTQTIDLKGVDLAAHYGVTPSAGGLVASGADTATIINGMLGDHSLKVDTV